MSNTQPSTLIPKFFEKKEFSNFFGGFTTRFGGVSTTPGLVSLNLSLSKESKDTVLKNRDILKKKIGLKKHIGCNDMDFASPDHGTTIYEADEPEKRPSKYDATILSTPGCVSQFYADCSPVVLVAPKAGVVAAVHSGWKGTLGRIVEGTVQKMKSKPYFCRPDDIYAAIGPTIRGCCYEFGPKLLQKFVDEYGEDVPRGEFEKKIEGKEKSHLDVVPLIEFQLLKEGVQKENIDQSFSICTFCDKKKRFFSCRRSVKEGVTFGNHVCFAGIKKQGE